MSNITANSVLIILVGVWLTGCSKKPDSVDSHWSLDKSAASEQLKSFVATRESLARALMEKDKKAWPVEYEAFFRSAEKGDWQAATNNYWILWNRVGTDTNLQGAAWSAMLDAYGVFELFPSGDEKYSIAFGGDIIKSIPDGSVYFGGTDAGRFLVTAMVESHAQGKPFFVLSQNPLADGTYLQYLRAMFGGKIYALTDEDLQKSLQDYTADAQRRRSHDQQFPNEPRQLKPGEDFGQDPNGRIQLRSQMSVIGVRELLTKTIFDKNPDREFYVEESFPLDWMYPYLEPHSLIMKINHQPLGTIPDETVQADHDYWARYIGPMIGDWLRDDTSIKEIAAFAEKTYARHDLGGFTGDPHFVQSTDAQKEFSKLRSSIGGLYLWRMNNTKDPAEKKQMASAADFAFRQAWALCPYSPEAVFRYINLLMTQDRGSDALLVAETAAKMPDMRGAEGASIRDVVKTLERYRK